MLCARTHMQYCRKCHAYMLTYNFVGNALRTYNLIGNAVRTYNLIGNAVRKYNLIGNAVLTCNLVENTMRTCNLVVNALPRLVRVSLWCITDEVEDRYVEPYFSRNGFLTRVKNSDLSRGVKNSTEFFTAAERIPHLSVTNSFGISFIYSTQMYLSPFIKTLKKVPFFHARISHKCICHSSWYKTYD